MLVLSRKLGEAIQIGEGIVIQVVEVRHSRVRLGIAAPPAIRIQRKEHIGELPELARGVVVADETAAGTGIANVCYSSL